MKIVYISTSILPSQSANSIHVMKVCQGFAQNGHEVVLIVPETPEFRGADIAEIYKFYGVDRNFKIASQPFLLGRVGALGYGVLAGHCANSLTPDVIYSRNILACGFTAKRIPTIFECHAPINRNWLTSRLLGVLIRRANLVRFVVITQALKDHFLASYPELQSKILVAPDAADAPAADCRLALLKSRPGSLDVGYVGHLYPGKGMEVVFPLAERCPWATFHVVGGTDNDLAVWRHKAAGIDNIVFYGHQTPAAAASYVSAFDVTLLPNQRTVQVYGSKDGVPGLDIGRWTSPLKMFEYMAHGKAILASDLPVLREILVHERNALLAPADDVDAWAVNLKRFSDDPTLRARLGANAKQEFLEVHTWQKRSALTIQDLPFHDV